MAEIKPMIHKYCQNGTYMLLDVNSGIINVIDKMTYDVLDVYDGTNKDAVYQAFAGTYDKKDLDETLGELDELIEKEMLFAPMTENFKVVAEEEPVIKSLCLNIAHDCNLRCQYCFASQGDYDTHKRELMSFDVAKHAVDLLIKSTEGKRQHCEIDFFGGEPLMNFGVVKQTIEYIREQEKIHDKVFKLSLTTNGMLLDPAKVKYLTDNHISLILSLDGRPEVHDRMRPDAGGHGSYKTCADNQVYAAKHRNGEEYYVRGTYTKYNLDFTKDVEHMADLGFEGLSMEPVVGDDLSYAITDDDLARIYEEYDRLADFYLKRMDEGRPFIYYHFIMDLYRGPCIAKRLRGCGAGHEYMCVVPNGDIYPCHQFVGQDDYVIGNVYVWFHRLVVAVSRPLHHYLCGNTQCQSVADECPSSGMGSQQGVFGCDGVYTFISLVVSFPYRVVDFRKFPQFFQIIVHLLVADDRKCLVIFKVYAFVFFQYRLAVVV